MATARVAGWLLALALLACLCLWSAADRLARGGVLLRLPAPFLTGGNALAAQAAEALRRDDSVVADGLARAAVLRRPADAPALRVAGLAAIAVGDTHRGDALMRLAGAAGWRDAPTQLYWAEAALASGALDVAAERLDAVARTGRLHEATRAGMLRLEATSAGRAALLRRLRVPGGWAAAYLPDVDKLPDAALEWRFLLVMEGRRSIPQVERTVDGLGWALVTRSRGDLAFRLASHPSGSWLVDFSPTAGTRTGPFAWQLEAAAGLDAAVEIRNRRPALHVTATGAGLLPVASQLTRLPPGSARLTLAIEGAKTAMPVIADLSCVEGSGATVVPDSAPPSRFGARLTVPPGCRTQRLSLAVTGEEVRRGADLWLSAPAVVPVASPAP